jgi:mono/diheme cytochrome c family protein
MRHTRFPTVLALAALAMAQAADARPARAQAPPAQAAAATAAPAQAPPAQSSPLLSNGDTQVAARDGEGIYRSVCQGCHMPAGQGATGAAAYPALANNPRLEAAGYPITVVVRGLRAMPAVGIMMDDAQVAAVVAYIRTNFGNAYPDPVSPDDVRTAR